MITTKLTITVNDKQQVQVQLKDPLSLPDMLQLLSTVSLQFMEAALTSFAAQPTPPAPIEEIKQNIYDMYNYAATNVLEHFAPELELRPDLTAQAILKAENEILLAPEFKQVSPTETVEITNKYDAELI